MNVRAPTAETWTAEEAVERVKEMTSRGIDLASGGLIPALLPPADIAHTALVLTSGLCLVADGFDTRALKSYLGTVRASFRGEGARYRQIFVPLSGIAEVRALFKSRESRQEQDEGAIKGQIAEILAEALRLEASDIHWRITDSAAILRYRIFGDLVERRQMTVSDGIQILTALYNAKDTGSHPSYVDREYQEASIPGDSDKLSIPPGIAAIRLQYNPLSFGRRLGVLRLHKRMDVRSLGLEGQGFSRRQIDMIKVMIRAPQGLVAASGPTGAGKTTTLMALILLMAREHPERLTITVEDPAEVPLPEAVQLALEGGDTLEDKESAYIRSMMATMRSDPDNILFGEMRDRHSARIAYQSSETGHLTLTTVHANDAVGILSRTRQLGVDEFYVFDPTLTVGLIGQRLIKRLCDGCKRPATAAELGEDWARLGPVLSGRQTYVRGPGCESCRQRLVGYSGRTAVAEILMPDDRFMELYRTKGKFDARLYWIEGMAGETMFDHAVSKVWDGEVDARDVEKGVGLLSADRFGLDKRREIYG